LETSPAEIQQTDPAPRRPNRRRGLRGLPSFKELKNLARTYLIMQHRLWPELSKSPLLPLVTNEAVAEMAKQFKKRFLRRRLDLFTYTASKVPWLQIAMSYLRYSDDNSNPRSLDQQLKLQLRRARDQRSFIPWQYVFADARITGTTAHRRGYKLAKLALRQDERVKILYIDEMGRASRDTVETLLLGEFVRRLNKRLLGVSDGFDIASPMATVFLSILAGLQQWFIEQLRSKVNRGMDDAFDEMANTGLAAIGYKLVPLLDRNGRQVAGKDGEPKMALAIEPATAKYVLLAFVLLGVKHWSRDEIATLFNEKKVDGRTTWDGSKILQMLQRWKYVGILTYRMTHREMVERGKGRGKVKIVHRPRREWRVRKARHLQIVPRSLWKAVRDRLKECKRAYMKRTDGTAVSRVGLYPTELIRPICGKCGDSMGYGHSGKYPALTCLNGKFGKKGCTFKGYKSVRIIEKAILCAGRSR
jgi:site-specific DNA recombinase